MSDLVVINYPSLATAEQAKQSLIQMAQQHLIELEDIVIVNRGPDGKVQLHQSINVTAGGALSGALWGGLVGLLFLNPLLGAAVGAGTGALTGRAVDYGINDEFARRAGEGLTDASADLMFLYRTGTTDRVISQLAHFGGQVSQTNLSTEAEAKIRAEYAAQAANAATAGALGAAGTAVGTAVGATTAAAQERMAAATDTLGDLKERATDAAHTVRDRISSAFDDVKARAADVADDLHRRTEHTADAAKTQATDPNKPSA
jgi:uncharacterized membrane protein